MAGKAETSNTLGWHRSKIGQMTTARARTFTQLLPTINIVLLIVNLHEIITDYSKHAKVKELVGKIALEVLLWSKEVVKKFMFVGEDTCMYHVANL